MSHRSPETQAHIAKKQAFQVLAEAEKKQADLLARREAERQYALMSLRAEHMDRDEYALRLLEQPEVLRALGMLDGVVAYVQFATRLLDAAGQLAHESARRDIVDIIAEKRRVGDSIPEAIWVVAQRHGISRIESPSLAVVKEPDGGAPA